MGGPRRSGLGPEAGDENSGRWGFPPGREGSPGPAGLESAFCTESSCTDKRPATFVAGWGRGKVWPPGVWGLSRGSGSKPGTGQEAGLATWGSRPRGTAYGLGIASVLSRRGVGGQILKSRRSKREGMEGREKEWSPPLNLKHRPKYVPPQSGVKKVLLEASEQERGGFCFWEKIAGHEGRVRGKRILFWEKRTGVGALGLTGGAGWGMGRS